MPEHIDPTSRAHSSILEKPRLGSAVGLQVRGTGCQQLVSSHQHGPRKATSRSPHLPGKCMRSQPHSAQSSSKHSEQARLGGDRVNRIKPSRIEQAYQPYETGEITKGGYRPADRQTQELHPSVELIRHGGLERVHADSHLEFRCERCQVPKEKGVQGERARQNETNSSWMSSFGFRHCLVPSSDVLQMLPKTMPFLSLGVRGHLTHAFQEQDVATR